MIIVKLVLQVPTNNLLKFEVIYLSVFSSTIETSSTVETFWRSTSWQSLLLLRRTENR